jgi:hypothetical protein
MSGGGSCAAQAPVNAVPVEHFGGHDMGLKTGITFHYLDRYFEFVDIELGNDNSFYFLPKQHEIELGDRIITSLDGQGNIMLKVDEIRQSGFLRRKISRHPSGYYHIKNVVGKGGSRQQDGLRGLPFAQMGGFHAFLVLAPQEISTLPEVVSPDPSHVTTHLPDSVEPFTVQFAVRDKNCTVDLDFKAGELLGGGVISIVPEQHQFGLVIMLVNLGVIDASTKPQFPIRTFVIVR